ncbi:MAG: glycosyltransferase, partial [Isosphaeraceae bacterium]|nr:glycosyltransferase [Isosphaeraceae bacterium]
MSTILVGLSAFLVLVINDVGGLAWQRLQILFILGGLASWRWGWWFLQCSRAVCYRYFVYPPLRRAAEAAVRAHGPVPEITVLATTYHEKPWITWAVFEAVFRELSTLEGLSRRPKVVVVGGCDEDDTTVRQIYDASCAELMPASPTMWPPELVLLRGDQGKRRALADGLREIARGNPGRDGVVVLMDGDSIPSHGMLPKVLPLFRLPQTVGAVTTNEDGYVDGPAWFAEWISMRFGQRHRMMCSVSLSGKLLCLTGRLSVFRASVATDEDFRAQIENDAIDHWLWGRFDMLSGDDKSTWYWLAARGYRMLYVPDALVTTIEVVSGSALQRAYANLKRWSGNTLRNSARVIALGPRRLGLFAWWCTIDQRLGSWSALVGPTVMLMALCTGWYDIAAGYLLWALVSRLGLAAIAWRHGRRFSAYYIPLQMVAEWANALIKIWVSFHPAKQSWLNRGGRTLDAARGSAFRGRQTFANYLCFFSLGAFGLAVGCYCGLLPLYREAPLYLRIGLPSVDQAVLDPGELLRWISARTVLPDALREAPLHARSSWGGGGPVGTEAGRYAGLLGYRPVLVPRVMSSPTGPSPPPSGFRRAR